MRRELVLRAVPRDERDGPALDLADEQRGRRRPVRRVDLDLSNVVEERVETRPPEDADLGGAQADFSLEELEDDPELDESGFLEESVDDEDEPESDEDDVFDFGRLSVL